MLGQHVMEGHYDLIGPSGEIILPQLWETVIRPGWSITMHMWPMPDVQKPNHRGHGRRPAQPPIEPPPPPMVIPANMSVRGAEGQISTVDVADDLEVVSIDEDKQPVAIRGHVSARPLVRSPTPIPNRKTVRIRSISPSTTSGCE